MDENLKSYLQSLLTQIIEIKSLLLFLGGIGAFIGFVLSFLVLPDYTSKQTLSLQDQDTFNSLLDGVAAPINSEKSILSGKAFLYSKQALFRIAINAKWVDSNSSKSQKISMINKIAYSSKIENVPRQNGVFEISFTHKNAREAQKLARIVAEAFVRETQNIRRKTATLALNFLTSKRKGILRELDSIETEKRKFKQLNLLNLPGSFSVDTKYLTRMKENLLSSKNELEETKQRLKLLKQSYKKYNPHKLKWISKLREIEVEIKEKQAYLKPLHPKMVNLIHIKNNILSQIEKLDKMVSNHPYFPNGELIVGDDGNPKLQGGSNSDIFWMSRRMQEQKLTLKKEELQAKISQFDSLLMNVKSTIKEIPRIEERLQRFDNEIKRLNLNYTEISEKVSDARHSIEITVLDAKSGYSVLLPANLPMLPDSPLKMKFSIFGLLIFVLIPIILLALKEYFRDRINDLGSLQRLSENTPVLSLPILKG